MNVSEGTTIGLGSALVAWLGSLLLASRKVGGVEQQFKSLVIEVADNKKEIEEQKRFVEKLRIEREEALQKVLISVNQDIEKLRLESRQEVTRLQLHHDQDMERMNSHKFITVPDHDTLCDKNNRLIVEAVKNLTVAMEKNTDVVSKMGERINTLNVDVAVLKDRRQSGNRQGGHEVTL